VWGKEWRELAVSRSFALLLLIAALLVGHAFMTAVATYAEMSGTGGGPSALAQGLSPLDGILVPTFGAYEIVATFLLPFIVIRLVGAERASGAWAVLLQSPVGVARSMVLKLLTLLAAWCVALLPAAIAVLLWSSYGGHIDVRELASVIAGHLCFGAVTIAIAMIAASIAAQPSTAAIIALGVTVGGWALDFAGATKGGAIADWAAFTPEAVLRTFEHGLVPASVLVIGAGVVVAAVAVSTTLLDATLSHAQRRARLTAIAVAVPVVFVAGSTIGTSWDLTEDRRYSFAAADAAALSGIAAPLQIEVRLAPEDPRRTDLERGVLAKLRRVMHVEVTYVATGRTGMFERPDARYGEVWYQIGDRRAMLRSTIQSIVLETIYEVAGVTPPVTTGGGEYPGYPLAARPSFAVLIFYGLWPALVIACFAAYSGALTSRNGGRRSP
jgi:hypothetical protein